MNIIQPFFAVFQHKLYSTRKFKNRIYKTLPQYKPFTAYLKNQIRKHKFSMLRDLYINEYWETTQRIDTILHHPHTNTDILKQLHTQLTAMSAAYELFIQARKKRQYKMYHQLWSEMFKKSAYFKAFINRVEFQLNTRQGELLCK